MCKGHWTVSRVVLWVARMVTHCDQVIGCDDLEFLVYIAAMSQLQAWKKWNGHGIRSSLQKIKREVDCSVHKNVKRIKKTAAMVESSSLTKSRTSHWDMGVG